MSSTLLNQELNLLAQQYSQTKKEEYLTDLVNKMLPICKRDSRNWAGKTGVPEADLLSVYVQAVQEAAKEYKPVGLFLKRYHFFKNRMGCDVVDHYKAQKRDIFKSVSLNKPISESEENSIEYGDTLTHTGDFARLLELQQLMVDFKEVNPKYGTVIEMCGKKEPTSEIARFLGEESYNDNARKQVSLARKAFRKFMNQ
jgi:hypothetical protein